MALVHEGKVAVVTGSSRGIGKVIALQLADDGASIAVCARTEQERDDLPGTIGETTAMIEAKGRQALAVRMDVANDDDVLDMFEQVIGRWGRIDILVNNAALVPQGAYLTSEISALENAFRVNVRAPYLISQLAAHRMATTGGGVIINISSGAARQPAPPTREAAPTGRGGGVGAVYGITKAALDRFATGVATELMAQNIAIVNLNPGFTITERFLRNARPDADLSRMERPETTAKAIPFVCRDPMAYTGRVLNSRDIVAENGL